MLNYIIRRILVLIPLLLVTSITSFIIIELPPGDFLTTYVAQLKMQNIMIREDEIARLTRQYGLDKPMYQRYFLWIKNIILHGDFGRSFQWNKPVTEVIGEHLTLTIVISISTIIFSWILAIPIGIYSAIHQYSISDYIFTFLGFIGLSIPGFLLALVLLWGIYVSTGIAITGLFSPEFIAAPWSIAKVLDLLKHMWVPLIIIGAQGTAGLIRTMRGNLLDELGKQYVVVARAKGLPERKVIFKYPVRMAINPLISTIGWMLPGIFSGETLVAIVLNLPTMGPLFMQALLAQDMYLAGSFVLIMGFLTLIGTLISDILLVWVDPRIRYENIGGG